MIERVSNYLFNIVYLIAFFLSLSLHMWPTHERSNGPQVSSLEIDYTIPARTKNAFEVFTKDWIQTPKELYVT